MSRTRKSAELLPILAAAFPRTFFIDPAQVQSLKIDIHLVVCFNDFDRLGFPLYKRFFRFLY